MLMSQPPVLDFDIRAAVSIAAHRAPSGPAATQGDFGPGWSSEAPHVTLCRPRRPGARRSDEQHLPMSSPPRRGQHQIAPPRVVDGQLRLTHRKRHDSERKLAGASAALRCHRCHRGVMPQGRGSRGHGGHVRVGRATGTGSRASAPPCVDAR